LDRLPEARVVDRVIEESEVVSNTRVEELDLLRDEPDVTTKRGKLEPAEIDA
jgi:hypothetical protein